MLEKRKLVHGTYSRSKHTEFCRSTRKQPEKLAITGLTVVDANETHESTKDLSDALNINPSGTKNRLSQSRRTARLKNEEENCLRELQGRTCEIVWLTPQ
eukprot:gnl/TRDRNA2_/TRDRNA2_148317_c0_seq1.p1 gnl/TRDRNA2_/TRDRNA2_148317_c0~~gnl/TRDRNA2_/TRDRNA2_148317_c0_seq1.p1  ORF type:complete len:100 (+),score=9.88 gnl/TRDRNA2_/TRDRNA2_148317_c0_seq1:50-349(+)